jgi:hypothetical protein
MILKRTILTAASVTVAALLMTACSPTGPQPTPTSTGTPTPTSTARGPVDPPKDEASAVAVSEETLTEWFVVRGEVNAAGGKDTDRLKQLTTGNALPKVLADASQIANGPQLNKDGKNIDGPAKTQGAIKYVPLAAYGQPFEGIENGLVTIHACQDTSDYKVWAHDGSEAPTRPSERYLFDFQVTYSASAKAWLVSDLISLNQTC